MTKIKLRKFETKFEIDFEKSKSEIGRIPLRALRVTLPLIANLPS
jgi:hypothetical protein